MSNSKKKVSQKYKLDTYDERIKVEADEFYAGKKKFKDDKYITNPLSKKMDRIYNIISGTAIDRLSKEKFIKFYHYCPTKIIKG